jgi:hypothetical protein
MATYTKGCLVRINTNAREVNGADFRIVIRSVTPSGPNFNITLALETAHQLSDISTFVSYNGASLYDDKAAGTPVQILSGLTTTGAPNELVMAFTGVVPTLTNGNNVWKVRVNNLIAVGKGGNTVTITTPIEVLFNSPL